MSAASALDALCRFFGGTYDAATHTYRTPQVSGLGVVRRAFAKRDDHVDYTLGAPGVANGCQMVIQLGSGSERRVAVAGASSGLKQVRHLADLHCFIRSTAAYAEDAQDYAYGLLDGIRNRVHGDRTCGTGGFEVGGIQAGEGDEPEFDWEMSVAESHAELTKMYLKVTFDIVEYVQA